MSAPALRLVQGRRVEPRHVWGSASPGGLLAEAQAPVGPRCLCGRSLVSRKCVCCGAPVADCPECPRTEWRAGRRVVTLARCEVCDRAGCRFLAPGTFTIRCRGDLGPIPVTIAGGGA